MTDLVKIARASAKRDVADYDVIPDQMIYVCQGSPRCEFEGDEAVFRQAQGCHWCEKVHIGLTVTSVKPGEA